MKCYLCGTPNLVTLTEQLRYGKGIVKYCDACSLGMLEYEKADLQKYYDEEYRKLHGPKLNEASSYLDIFEAHVHYQAARVELLTPQLKPDMRLLEVGCSTGHFMYNIKPYVKEIIGVDYDSQAARFAGEKCQCKTFGCGLDETGLEEHSFDVVCAIQTMEHVEDPINFATLLGKYVKPKGIVYIEVPNLKDPLLSLYENESYHTFYFHKAHLFYFTAQSLITVMERAGFSGEVQFMQDYNFINHLHWSLTGKPQSAAHEGLSPSKLPIARNTASIKLREELDDWMKSVDGQYKEILVKHGLTDNIAFIGKVFHQ